MKTLTSAERLIVAADFKPSSSQGRDWVLEQVLGLANDLKGTGVCLKVNSALRLCGHGLINEIHDRGLAVFTDLKLNDIPETMATDGSLLAAYKPDLVTCMASSGRSGMEALKKELPAAEVLAVTVLTSLSDGESLNDGLNDSLNIFGSNVIETVQRFATGAAAASLDGLICSPKEVRVLRSLVRLDGMSINTPGIRPLWSQIANDDQQRIMTPADAIAAGVDRLVVGRPITQAENRRDAAMRTIDEIDQAAA